LPAQGTGIFSGILLLMADLSEMEHRLKDIYRILVVDDSQDDLFFLRKVIRRNPRFIIVGEVCNGDDAIAYLSGQGVFSDRGQFPFPDTMLLDLKMPRKSGFEVLEWLQEQSFDRLTVVVLSGSNLPEDISKALKLGADAYKTKTNDEKEQVLLLRDLEELLDRRHSL